MHPRDDLLSAVVALTHPPRVRREEIQGLMSCRLSRGRERAGTWMRSRSRRPRPARLRRPFCGGGPLGQKRSMSVGGPVRRTTAPGSSTGEALRGKSRLEVSTTGWMMIQHVPQRGMLPDDRSAAGGISLERLLQPLLQVPRSIQSDRSRNTTRPEAFEFLCTRMN